MCRAVWGLPQAGILANKLLQKRLMSHGYYKCKQTPGLWKLTTRPIPLTPVVDNFGMKYEQQEDIDHLIKCVRIKYELTEDWMGNLYCSINLKWDYNHCTLDISMPGYIKKQLQKYKHASPCAHNTARMPQCQNNMAASPSAPSPLTRLPHYPKMISSTSSKL